MERERERKRGTDRYGGCLLACLSWRPRPAGNAESRHSRGGFRVLGLGVLDLGFGVLGSRV